MTTVSSRVISTLLCLLIYWPYHEDTTTAYANGGFPVRQLEAEKPLVPKTQLPSTIFIKMYERKLAADWVRQAACDVRIRERFVRVVVEAKMKEILEEESSAKVIAVRDKRLEILKELVDDLLTDLSRPDSDPSTPEPELISEQTMPGATQGTTLGKGLKGVALLLHRQPI